MERLEFVIILTKHRHLGMVFYPYLIQKDEKFYSDLRRVKKCDLKDADYNWKPYEQKLVKLTERYSDEALKKRFSRVASVTDFFSTLEPAFFEKHISPYIEKCMMDVTRIIMQNPVRLFKKEEKYVNLYDEDEINVPTQFAQPLYCFERTETHTRYTLKVRLNNADVLLSKQTCMVVANNPCLMLSRNKLIAFEKMNAKRILPFFGKAHVAYIPNGTITGLSKIARVVDVFARRLQVQERLTTQIKDCIQETLQPLGVAVVIEAQHLCMQMRGIQKQGSITTTSDFTGAFEKVATRDEFIKLIGTKLS